MNFNFFKSRAAATRRMRGYEPPPRSLSPTNLLLALLLWLAVLALLETGTIRRYSALAVGQKAPATVIAAVDFTCADAAGTELARQQAAEQVLPVFTVNLAPLNAANRALDKLFDRLLQQRAAAGANPDTASIEHAIGDAADLLGFALTAAEVMTLAPTGREEQVLLNIKDSLRAVWLAGIVSAGERLDGLRGTAAAGRLTIRNTEDGVQTTATVTNLPDAAAALSQTVRAITARQPDLLPAAPALSNLLAGIFRPNLLYDPAATAELKRQAAAAVPTLEMRVRAGATIVEDRERVTPQVLEMLRAHEKRLNELESPRDRLLTVAGDAGLLLAILLACAGFLNIFQPAVLRNTTAVLLLGILSLLSLLLAKGLLLLSANLRAIPPWLADYLVPASLAPLLAVILLGSAPAFALGLWNSFALMALFDNNLPVLISGLFVTVIVILLARDVRRRAVVIRAGFFAGAAEMLVAVSLGALHQTPPNVLAAQAGTALLSGLGAALIATILIPLFEVLFRITTNITLLELSDMAHPLLRRLALEAPGTYHHSLMVASLGEAAAARIGANSLLVRVCAYFHDIGKLAKPEFFSENTHLRENPHDDLSPSMSTLVILSHVKEGVGLVKRYKLPRPIVDAIEQHHGTGLVSYFYHMARQQQEAPGAGQAINDEDFRYEGPRPRSREIAILALADSVEAASRSLEKPTPTRIANLVHDVVNLKLTDGQLEDCELTLAELTAIQQSFVFSLTNMLHARTAYPTDENKRNPPTGKNAAGNRGSPETDRLDS